LAREEIVTLATPPGPKAQKIGPFPHGQCHIILRRFV
jgi:hypothetical protein